MECLDELLEDMLKDIYNAEHQLLKALPRMIRKASSSGLKQALSSHLRETENQVKRLETIGKTLDIKLTGKKCAAMQGLVEEGKEVLEEGGESPLIDAALCGAGLRVEHYETAAYTSARAVAQQLGQSKVVGLLQQSLDEEIAAGKKLEEIAARDALPGAMAEHAEKEEESMASARG